MTGFLSLRLAWRNIRRNRQTYAPFLLATSLLTFALFAFNNLSCNPGIREMETGEVLFSYLLTLGGVVVAVFTYIFLFYANSFLIRRRKTEFGLYGVLGLERRHIVAVMFWELALILLITMALGMGLGTLLTRLMFLIIRALTRLDIPLTDTASPQAIATTAALVAVLFAILFVYNALQVRLAKPIDLLHARQQGEKEPKARWLFTLIGLAAMIAGYVIALRVNNPITALISFFVAVLLVILGTYLLFMTGSIALLKMLRARKSFYYQPKHFVNISGMMFRMKQNAAGLASIAILCTMAMVTFGATGALYLGLERSISELNPADVVIEVSSEADLAIVEAAVEEVDARYSLTVRDRYTYRSYDTALYWKNGEYVTPDQGDISDTNFYDNYYFVTLMPLEDFNRLEGASLTLGSGELGLYGDGYRDRFMLCGQTWDVQRVDRLAFSPSRYVSTYNMMVLVTPDWDTLLSIAEAMPYTQLERSWDQLDLDYCLRYDLEGSAEEKLAYDADVYKTVREALSRAHTAPVGGGDGHGYSISITLKASATVRQYAMFGTLLFVGIFLGLIFLMGTALIIYFKQISEGHQDRERFAILQKVGMDQRMVRRCVRQQILLVFFLPLIVALVHVLGSLNLISLMINAFGLADKLFINLCSIGSALIVAAVYLAFYGQTAHSYYKLVRLEVKT
ncbi:MAG: FtsX-like permease family protein [Christensenellaceae bacterium]|nr:FtsX-like permease family protein [Christensenellaceae bacterium]